MRTANSTHFQGIFICFALITLCSLKSHGQAQAAAQAQDNAVAIIQAVEGKVMILSGSVAKPATEGNPILPGDKIQTVGQAKARLVFDDDNTIDIGGNSELDVSEYDFATHVLLKLWRGAIDLLVNKKYDGNKSTFQIETKSSVVGVRGTEYTVEYSDTSDETNVSVTSGEVELGRKREAHKIVTPGMIKAGYEGRFLKDAPEPVMTKFDPIKFRALREKIRTRLQPRHHDVLRKWRDHRVELFKKRGIWREKIVQREMPKKNRVEDRKNRTRKPNSVFSKARQKPGHKAFGRRRR